MFPEELFFNLQKSNEMPHFIYLNFRFLRCCVYITFSKKVAVHIFM